MKCGIARIEITPPFATALFGYPGVDRIFEPHKDRMLDPLQARVVCLQDGESAGILILSLDLCILMDGDAHYLRQVLGEKTGMTAANILVACTHTHSAPLARFVGNPANGVEQGFIKDPDDTSLAYGKWLTGRLVKAAKLAVSRRSPVNLSYLETFSGLGYNRRCMRESGIKHCWNLQEFPDRIPQPAQSVLHAVLRLDYQNKPGGVLLESAGIHPVVMGKFNNRASADWPGHARRHMERRMRAYQAVFFEGAAAQVQPWISTQDDPRALRWVGEALGGEALLMALNGRPLEEKSCRLKLESVNVPERKVEISVLTIGEILVLAVPFELSCAWAAHIRQSLGRPVFFICLCNGWDGYWMAPDEFEEGGYEADIARARGVGPEHSAALLERLKPYKI